MRTMDHKVKSLVIILLAVTFLSIGISLAQYLELDELLRLMSAKP